MKGEAAKIKTAKAFLAGMYLHLLLSIVAPVGILLLGQNGRGWNAANGGMLVLYLLEVAAVQVLGWIAVGAAAAAYQRGEIGKLRDGWKLLKLNSIPFYILNFLYSCFAWFILVGASRGILVLLVPIPVVITGLMVVQSGCVGAFYLRYLRFPPENGKKPHGVHYALQLLPVLDVVSTLLILRSGNRAEAGR